MSVSALALGLAAPALAAAVVSSPAEARADVNTGVINGVVRNEKTGTPVADAIIVVQCSCLQGQRETRTNESGLYSLRSLPPGRYTVQALTGQADVSKIVDLPRGAKYRVNITIDPGNAFVRRVVVEQKLRSDTAVVERIDMDAAHNLPLGGRDMTDVVDIAPTVTRDAGGLRIGGTGSDESKYSVDGANVNSPSFGQVGATIVQEFIDTVEVQEAGYDAEYGGASGGQVSARRIGGSNKVRGTALVRYTPRLADPRLIAKTDEALRASSVTDHQMQAVITVSGPIVRDKVFFAVGIAPAGNINSLIQGFYHRVDKDRSGGYSVCTNEPGEHDCAPGQTYILTSKFAEQKFKTGRVNMSWFGRVDWTITPKHNLTLSGGGSPTFDRTTYRLRSSSTPNTFGTNPASTLGGLARVATGIVNDHFGWGRGGYTQVGLGYSGRVAKDTLEIDAGLSYYQDLFEEAWRLDNPELKDIPSMQENGQRGLFEVLDRDNALNLVPGVSDSCNRADIPGDTCPIRFWISGGLGQYNKETNRRVEGRLNLTHFFNIARTSHQLKYGSLIEHVERDTVSTFSGSNAEDFYNRCATPQIDGGGGEYCYDAETDTYSIDFGNRVNNNRLISTNAQSPATNGTTGFGVVRREQGDLRALATPIGSGVRAPNYSAVLSTQNYALFLQDRVQLLPGLYVSGGVRWEMQSMRDINGQQALFIPDNVAPRVGITYDWTGEGKSRLFASYGHFYRTLPLQLNSRVFGGLVTVGRSYRGVDCEGTVNIDGVDHAMSERSIPTEYCVDRGGGTGGLTVGSVVPNLKGQYNKQFQVGYEQEVIEDLLVGVRWLHNSLGRAVDDVSTNGGLGFIVANPGEPVSKADIEAKRAECDAIQEQLDNIDPDDPTSSVLARESVNCEFLASSFERLGELYDPPFRNYDAWTLLVRKRFARNWLFNFSYTYSRLIGNYDGSIDRNTGAVNLGVSTQFDLPELVRNSFGPLYENRPHSVKSDIFYQFDLREAGRLTLGTSFRYVSGTPINHMAPSGIIASVFVLPRGSGGTTDPLYTWNIQVAYAYPLPKELELEVSARLVNLTNSKAIVRVDENYSSYTTHPVAGGDLDDLKHTKARGGAASQSNRFYNRAILPPSVNHATEIAFQQPLSAQFELRFRF